MPKLTAAQLSALLDTSRIVFPVDVDTKDRVHTTPTLQEALTQLEEDEPTPAPEEMAELGTTASAEYAQAELQGVIDKIDAVINSLKALGLFVDPAP